MLWIYIAVFSYFFFALAALGDKLLLANSLKNSKTYAFYVGVLGLFALLFFPFLLLDVPSGKIVLLALAAGAARVLGMVFYFEALLRYEASRVAPVLGAFGPLAVLFLVVILNQGDFVVSVLGLFSFFLLILGSVLISWEGGINKKNLVLCFWSALLFGVFFVFSKLVYLEKDFMTGFALVIFSQGLAALSLLAYPDVRNSLRRRERSRNGKMAPFFFLNQAIGAGAFMLQNYAVALAPFALMAFINALAGVQYIFLIVLTVSVSFFCPRFLKENYSLKNALIKIIGTALIILGLMLLSFGANS